MPALVNRTLQLNGRDWYLTELFLTPENAANFPNYTATSYRWYNGRLPNPFFDGFLMSNLTLPSLESTMRNSPHEAFWIDCFSIPAEPPLKGKILDLLSNIFSAANEVVVPLGLNSRDTLPLLAGNSDLSKTSVADLEAAMRDLDQEQWVKSIWTYKEALSAKRYTFSDRSWATGASNSKVGEPKVADVRFFSRVAEGLELYARSQNWTDYDAYQNLPNVDGLVNIGLDRQLSGATYSRSVFQSLSSFDRRYVESDKNFFWGLYGASRRKQSPPTEAPRSRTCTGSYSRSVRRRMASPSSIPPPNVLLRLTRPSILHRAGFSIVTWATDGNYQTGNVTAEGIQLNGMVTLEQTPALGQRGRAFIGDWFASGNPEITEDGSDTSISRKALEIIKMVGYAGSEDPLFTDDGIFFPQWTVPVNATSKTTVLATSQLGWSFGSPEFAKTQGLYVPGAFIGYVAAQEAGLVLM